MPALAQNLALSSFNVPPAGRILMHHLREVRHSRGTYGACANFCSPLFTIRIYNFLFYIYFYSRLRHTKSVKAHTMSDVRSATNVAGGPGHTNAGLTKITKTRSLCHEPGNQNASPVSRARQPKREPCATSQAISNFSLQISECNNAATCEH